MKASLMVFATPPTVNKKTGKIQDPPKPIVPDGTNIPFCVVVDCSGFSYIDLMGINVLKQVYLELKEVGISVYYAACNRKILSFSVFSHFVIYA